MSTRRRKASSRFSTLPFLLPLLSIFLLLLVSSASASSGDRDPQYQTCLDSRRAQQCEGRLGPAYALSLALRVLRWDCEADIRYECMWDVTNSRTDQGLSVLQYYGKWPFYRLWGVQEPASVLFSILNGYAHYKGWKRLREVAPASYALRNTRVMYALVSINSWVWSSVFHSRDTYWTERLDYWSAALAIMFGLYLSVTRVLKLYVPRPHRETSTSNGHSPGTANGTTHTTPQRSYQPIYDMNDPYIDHDEEEPIPDVFAIISSVISNAFSYLNIFSSIPPRVALWRALCILLYTSHVTYLALLPRFDYSYNVIACAVAGGLAQLTWLVFAWRNRHREYAWRAAAIALGMGAAMSLELGDFPALGRARCPLLVARGDGAHRGGVV
ncbi:Per1-like protein [Gonapodya prolifera JEL478]|uniref:Post-GPI attachment to proteins factor 3 n=1 Tax=Gonapodya prolifera (strain JEL478) TaxID=1344416 RepID=A0A138ZYU7_GONPJ|nr:Per1-like protein [Gonapodya prolifera JEL478]|eukprot:KXS09684.1 Per1-like protein [Gonapodya prolifera JEL478]